MYKMNANTNVAYDLSMFDTDERAEVRAKQRAEINIKLHKVSVAKSGNWFKTIVGVACATVLAISVLNCKATISELSAQISDKTSELELAQRENVRLQTSLDNLVTLSKVEESANGELGLQKTAKTQVRYIPISGETMVEVSEENDNVFVSINSWFNDVLEYLGF